LRGARAQDVVLEFAAIAQTLEETRGNWAEAARRLGMDRSNLHHMAHRLGVISR
jgi:anaerobic nitric oxide reductase transcription regulator